MKFQKAELNQIPIWGSFITHMQGHSIEGIKTDNETVMLINRTTHEARPNKIRNLQGLTIYVK